MGEGGWIFCVGGESVELRRWRQSYGFCLFVLETIRTGAMRVVHITVNTEESQILRIKFVLVLSYLNSNTVCPVLSYLCFPTQASLPFQLSIRSKILATKFVMILTTNKSTIFHCQQIKQQVDISTFE